MRIGYNWRYGPFELIDRLGARYLAERLAREKLPGAAAARQGGRRPAASIASAKATAGAARRSTAPIARSRAPAGRAAAGRHQARRQAAGRQWLGQPLGYRRRRRLPRIPQQDEQHRSRQLPAAAPIARSGRQAQAEGAGDPQRGREFLRRAQSRPRPVLGQSRDVADDRGHGRDRASRPTRPSNIRAFPVVGAPSGMALGGGCEILLHCAAIVAHAETYIGLVEAGVGLVPGLGRLQGAAGAQHRPSQGPWAHAAGGRDLRDHLHRQGRALRGRGEAAGLPRSRATRSS